MTQTNTLYDVSCGHVVEASTGIYSQLKCPRCDSRVKVNGVHVHEWRAVCRSCSFARWCGLSSPLAGFLANAHARRKRGHNVVTEYIRNPVAVMVEKKMQRAGIL